MMIIKSAQAVAHKTLIQLMNLQKISAK